jgi:hypothetical protein
MKLLAIGIVLLAVLLLIGIKELRKGASRNKDIESHNEDLKQKIEDYKKVKMKGPKDVK